MSGIHQGFGDVRTHMPWWMLGAKVEASGNDEVRTALNAYPQAVEVTTVTVADPAADVTVALTINGVVVSVLTVGDITAAALGAQLAAAINAEPLVRGQVVATFDTVTLTLTGTTPGVPITVTEADANLSAVTETTASDAADPIEFGRAVMQTGWQGTDELVRLASSTGLTAQVITTSITYVAGAINRVQVYEVRGESRVLIADVDEVSATDRDTMIDALVALLNTALPAASVIVTADNATGTALVFTSEVPGLAFDADVFPGHEGATLPVVTKVATVPASSSTSFLMGFRGVALRDEAIGSETVAGTEQRYPGNSAISYLRKGVIAVECSEVVTPGGFVYVELGVAADNGKFFAADSATRIALPKSVARWELDADANTGNLAALRLMGA